MYTGIILLILMSLKPDEIKDLGNCFYLTFGYHGVDVAKESYDLTLDYWGPFQRRSVPLHLMEIVKILEKDRESMVGNL